MSSILDQTLTDWELVVCDSYSDDGTWEALSAYKDDPRIQLHQVPREGLYAGWNECLRRCRGKYVYIAPADDTCLPRALEVLVGALESCKQPAQPRMAMCQFDFIDDSGKAMSHHRDIPASFFGELNNTRHIRSGQLECLVHLLLGVSWVTYTALLFRRDLLDEVGFFPTDCGAMGDRIWAIRSAMSSDMVSVPDRLATWRLHAGQASARMNIVHEKQLRSAVAAYVSEIHSGLSAKWAGGPFSIEDLLHGVNRNYLIQFCLDRLQWRLDHRKFVKGLGMAFRLEPAYLLRRVLTGFSWDCPEYEEERVFFRRKLAEWNVPPPVVLL